PHTCAYLVAPGAFPSPQPARSCVDLAGSAVVGELQGHVEVARLQHGDDGLQVVLLLGRDAQLVALDLRLDTLRALVADLLADRLGLVRVDALDDLAVDLVTLARGLRLAGVERLQRDLPL